MIPDESDSTTVSQNVVVFQRIPLIQNLIQNRSIPSLQLWWTVEKVGLSSGIQPLTHEHILLIHTVPSNHYLTAIIGAKESSKPPTAQTTSMAYHFPMEHHKPLVKM